MTEQTNTRSSPVSDFHAMDEAVRRAMRDAVLTHARAGRSVPTWRDGRVTWITPDEILRQFPSSPSTSAQS